MNDFTMKLADARRFLEDVARTRTEIGSEIRRLRAETKNVAIRQMLSDGHRTAFVRAVSALPSFDNAKDAGNWNGTPLVGGNVGGSKEERGNLTQLKRAGLIETFQDDGLWISFTEAGRRLAAEHGINIIT